VAWRCKADGPARRAGPRAAGQRCAGLDAVKSIATFAPKPLRHDVPLIGTTIRRSWPPSLCSCLWPGQPYPILPRQATDRRAPQPLEAARSRRVQDRTTRWSAHGESDHPAARRLRTTLHIDRMTVEFAHGDTSCCAPTGSATKVSELSIEQLCYGHLQPGVRRIDRYGARPGGRDNITAWWCVPRT